MKKNLENLLHSNRFVFFADLTNPGVEVKTTETPEGGGNAGKLPELTRKANNALESGKLTPAEEQRLREAMGKVENIKNMTEAESQNATQVLIEELKLLPKSNCEKEIAEMLSLRPKFESFREAALQHLAPAQLALVSFKSKAEAASTQLSPEIAREIKQEYKKILEKISLYDPLFKEANNVLNVILQKQQAVSAVAPLFGLQLPNGGLGESDRLPDLAAQLTKTKIEYQNATGLML